MGEAKKSEQWMSFAGVVLLALILPGMLKMTNSIVRFMVGAEGRLSAITVDTERELGPMQKNWLALAQGGENLKNFMDLAGDKVKMLKPEYIRIDHVYDEFGVVNKVDGKLVYNWGELDKLVGQITASGAKPFFSLSYMPKPLTTGDDIYSEPQNWNDWSELVRQTITHYSGSLGIEGIYYEIWNEPDLYGKWKIGGDKDYRNLYAFAVKGALQAENTKPFKIGGVATTSLYQNWVDGFLLYVMQNKLRLDFYSWHRYDPDPARYTEDIKSVEKWLDKYPFFTRTEMIISEMGPTNISGGINDTNVGAAHLVAVARELIPKVKYGFNFAISGNWGLVGKPRYDALSLLSRLGDRRLPVSGEGTWVRAIAAQNGSKLQVILVNYDTRETHTEVVPVTFINLKNKQYILTIETLGGAKLSNEVATSEAVWQTTVPMGANTVALVEMEPKQ